MKPIIQLPITRYDSGSLNPQSDTLAEEAPIALVYNGISHVVMMVTPQNLFELALGFSLSEGILQRANQLYDCEVVETEQGIEVRMEIASERFLALKERRRSINGRTGCGLCGVDSLAAVSPCIHPITERQNIAINDIAQALADFAAYQPLRERTGSLHAAAWVEKGKIQAAFEDIGRHNALDKLLGYLAHEPINRTQGWVMVSSRASYEMVAKTAALGIGCLVAVSAATALAVRLAERANITLIGFAKVQKMTVYTHDIYLK